MVSLLGRNGVGRSTTVKAIMGEFAAGHHPVQGQQYCGSAEHKIAHLGLGYVPEHRGIFPGLTVRQNLMLGVKDPRKPGKWRLEDMLQIFNLAARADTAAGVMSGGEKQMLTICRTLMGDPELVMIDEPTEGLAPLIVHQVGAPSSSTDDEDPRTGMTTRSEASQGEGNAIAARRPGRTSEEDGAGSRRLRRVDELFVGADGRDRVEAHAHLVGAPPAGARTRSFARPATSRA